MSDLSRGEHRNYTHKYLRKAVNIPPHFVVPCFVRILGFLTFGDWRLHAAKAYGLN